MLTDSNLLEAVFCVGRLFAYALDQRKPCGRVLSAYETSRVEKEVTHIGPQPNLSAALASGDATVPSDPFRAVAPYRVTSVSVRNTGQS